MWTLTLWLEMLGLWRCLGQRAHLRPSQGQYWKTSSTLGRRQNSPISQRHQTSLPENTVHLQKNNKRKFNFRNRRTHMTAQDILWALTEGYVLVQWRWWLSSGSEPCEGSAWCWAASSCRSHTGDWKHRKQTSDIRSHPRMHLEINMFVGWFTCRTKTLWLSLWGTDSVWWGADRYCTLCEETIQLSVMIWF